MRRALLLSLAILSVPSAARARATVASDTVTLTADQALDAAERLIASGAYPDAETVLRTVATGDPAATDMLRLDYLAGLLAEAQGRDEEAERLYSAVLAYDASLTGARFRLAGVQSRRGAHAKAERNFRRVTRDRDVAAPLAQMSHRGARRASEARVFRTDVSAGVVPSTNVNAGTSAEEMLAFGFLPVPLDDETRARSGLGMRYAVGASARPVLAEGARAHLRVHGSLTDHSGARFDDASLGAQAALIARRGGRTGRLSLGTTQRMFGGQSYLTRTALGAGLSLTPHERVRLGLDASVAYADYARDDARDGPVYAAGLGVEVAGPWRVRLGASASGAREEADAEALANTQGTFSLSASRALPLGLRGTVSHAYTARRFDEATALFATRREDGAITLRAAAEAARWDWLGLRPSVAYGYTINRSTVAIYSYDRHVVDVGVARGF